MQCNSLKGDSTLLLRQKDNNTAPTFHHYTAHRMLIAALSILLCACSQQPRQDQADDALTMTEQAAKDRKDEGLTYASIDEMTMTDISSRSTIAVLQCVPESGVAWMEPKHEDIWARIRYGYGLNLNFDNPRISAELDWFGSHQKYINRVTDRATPYLYYVAKELERHNVPMEIALLPIVESAYDPFAYSHGKAAGMWQFISSTGELYGLKQNWWYDGRRDVRESTRAAIAYLSYLAKHYHGDWELALAAYNTGQGNVDRAIRRNKKQGLATDFWSLKLPRETTAYVPRLLAVARIIADPAAYDLTLNSIPNTPYFAAVSIGSQIDLAEASQMADITTEEMYRLNPGFNRWATDPRGPFELLIPLDKAERFNKQLTEQASSNRVNWQQYQVVAGDSLNLIAKRHNTSVAAISEANRLRDSTIYAGRTLVIPLAGSSLHRGKSATAPAQRFEYSVRPGDSFWAIARQHKVSEQQLRKWNGLSSDAPLLAGSQLTLWRSPTSKQASNSVNQPLPAPYIRKVGYTVRRGDTLSQIASKFSVNLNDVRKWNPLQQSENLLPGQRLTLYVDITKAK
jgi:membrane-bound lytic murein transglycosylase D